MVKNVTIGRDLGEPLAEHEIVLRGVPLAM
jgi:hypothetical protein